MRDHRGPGVRVPPPTIFIVAFLVGIWLEGAMYRIRVLDADLAPRPLVIIGALLIFAGVLVALWGVWTFRRYHTPVLPVKAATSLVRAGPYRFTRNPMYLGMTLAHIGGSLALNAMWPLILLPPALVVLFHFVIRREEQHLHESFGEEYGRYRSEVRRWI